MSTQDEIREKYDLLKPHLRGPTRRLWAAAEAIMHGRGGITSVSHATGICAPSISRGVRELKDPQVLAHHAHPRAPATGRPRVEQRDPGIIRVLERLLADETAGDPMTEQRWVRSSLRKLQLRLAAEGHQACVQTVANLLRRLGYSLKVNHKKRTAARHPDRELQFKHIAEQKRRFLAAGLPVISVDTKKKEFIGDFKNNGRVWCREATEVNQYDFSTGAECLAVPYGVYDVGRNKGFVVVGVSHNTAMFAATAITRW